MDHFKGISYPEGGVRNNINMPRGVSKTIIRNFKREGGKSSGTKLIEETGNKFKVFGQGPKRTLEEWESVENMKGELEKMVKDSQKLLAELIDLGEKSYQDNGRDYYDLA